MFSEYASRYLAKSQRPAPLFNREQGVDSDVDDYLEQMSGSTDGSLSESEAGSLSSSDDDESAFQTVRNDNEPPSEMLMEGQSSNGTRSRTHRSRTKKQRVRKGRSLWQRGIQLGNQVGNHVANPFNCMPQSTRNSTQNNAAPNTTSNTPTPNTIPQANSRNHIERDVESGQVRSAKYLDNTVALVYCISLAVSLATAALVALSAPDSPNKVYPIFVYSAKPLAYYTVLAGLTSALWLYCMRCYPKAVVQLSVFTVPSVLVVTSVLSMVLSLHSAPQGVTHTLAHAVMRLSALAPLAVAVLWVLYLRRMKDVVGKAGDIVAFGAEVYAECMPAISVVPGAMGAFSIAATGLWAFFLARAFLEGRAGYILVLWFSFMYLWTWSLVCRLLCAVLACVTAEWYADNINNENEEHSMKGVVARSVFEVASSHFSSACLSALVALIVRVPLLLLPRKLTGPLRASSSVLLGSSITRMLDPLTFPTAIQERCSLAAAAQIVGSPQFAVLDRRAYRLAKLFLVAARITCSMVVAFIAWVHADRVQDASSSYAYMVAIVALFIGWTVVGASENILSMICDLLLVSYVVNKESPRRTTVERLFTNEDVSPEDGLPAEGLTGSAPNIESEYSDDN